MKMIEESFIGNVLRLVIKEACNQGVTHSFHTPKNVSIKLVPQVVICDIVAHDMAYSR